MREHNTQYPEKLNVWTEILIYRLIGPFFVYVNLNAANYAPRDMLQNQIVPIVRRIAGENFEHVWFQQDAAFYFRRNVFT